MSDFVSEETVAYSIQDNFLCIDGMKICNIKLEDEVLILYNNKGDAEVDFYDKFQRIKGFK